jgi:hypothetical protein
VPCRNASARTLIVAVLVGIIPVASHAGQTASLDLLRRAVDPNPTLTSYTASAQLSATLHVLVPVRKNISGTVYYLKPRRKIEFENVSGELARFKDLASSTPTYDEATAQYTITPLTDDGTTSTYSFVPKKAGSRVKSVTISVNDQSVLVSNAHWAYTNGGSLVFGPVYSNVGTYRLPAKVNIAARFPGYSVDGTLTFSNYKPNAAVSPSVFATSQ